MQALVLPILPLVLAGVALASPLLPRATQAATVDLGIRRGTPQHLASGFIYGIPDTPNQVPDHFYTNMGFNYARAGGAQLEEPARGWIWGLEEYYGRLNSTLSNYFTARKYGANFIILPHDIWGTDHSNDSTVWPGDDGDFTDYDKFLTQLFQDLKDNDALDGLVFDVWNEPDLTTFWARTRQQWIDMYIHTHKFIRSDSDLDGVEISGPSLANAPQLTQTWWNAWLSAIAGNDTIPEQYSWHLEGSVTSTTDDLQNNNVSMKTLLAKYNLADDRLININEYGVSSEQIPAGAAWWISRLERYDAVGLRGNWLSGTQLHDFFANLISKTNTTDYYSNDYFPASEYQVYKYYNLNQTGERVNTTGTSDRLFDVYATVDDDKVRILSGVRLKTGTWAITVNNLTAVGLPESGTIDIQTWGFDGTSVWQEVDSPSDRGIVSHSYSDDTLTFPIYQTDTHTAWAFEFDI